MENTRVVLARRPKGIPAATDFRVETAPVREPEQGELIVETRFWSVDPAMRGWVNDVPNYLPPVEIDAVMRSFAVGTVVESRSTAYPVGTVVTGMFGWQHFATIDEGVVDRVVTETDLPQSLALGILGLNGITAYLGLMSIGNPRPGETVVVSTAAGSVGSAVGQIASLKGCRTVGVAGGPEKAALCRDAYGYDAAIDYRNADVAAELANACPDGVDVYFDNTCGPISDAVMENLALRARIIICGTASVADWDPLPQGPRVHRQLLVKRARIEGFLVFDHADRYDEARAQLASWVRSGELAYREHVLAGPEAAPDTIAMLYRGENKGKLLIDVSA